MVAHEVLAGQDRVLLDPDHRLREVQSGGLEHRRVVAAVGVAAPDVESPARFQHAGQVAEPGVQEAVELRFADEVVGQGPVLGPQLLSVGLAFLGWRTTSSFWWCIVPANEDRPAAMALLLRGSTFTL